jgi:hypothetical protein
VKTPIEARVVDQLGTRDEIRRVHQRIRYSMGKKSIHFRTSKSETPKGGKCYCGSAVSLSKKREVLFKGPVVSITENQYSRDRQS